MTENGKSTGWGLKTDLTILGGAAAVIFAVGSAWMEIVSRTSSVERGLTHILESVNNLSDGIDGMKLDLARIKGRAISFDEMTDNIKDNTVTIAELKLRAANYDQRIDRLEQIVGSIIECISSADGCKNYHVPFVVIGPLSPSYPTSVTGHPLNEHTTRLRPAQRPDDCVTVFHDECVAERYPTKPP